MTRAFVYVSIALTLLPMGFTLAQASGHKAYPPAKATHGVDAVAVVDTLAGQATDVWPFRLNGLMHARITVRVDNPLLVECRLHDPDGKPVKLGSVVRDRCRFAWTPARTGAYRLEVRNLTSGTVPYVIHTRQSEN